MRPMEVYEEEEEEEEEETEEEEEEDERPHDYDELMYKEMVNLINEEPTSSPDYHARRVVGKVCRIEKPLNLMDDSVLHEVITNGKTCLAVAIVDLPDSLNGRILKHQNYYGDTPLHKAAEIGNSAVAKALLKKDQKLAGKRNWKGETPLHKAVQYGQIDVFQSIMESVIDDSIAYRRTYDGSTILHYAIMHEQTKEALVIARDFQSLIPTRNTGGASPLQIMAAFYKKPRKTETLISRLRKHLSLDKDTSIEESKVDEEGGSGIRDEPRNWWSRLPGRIMGKKATHEEMSNYDQLLKLLVRNEDFEFYIKGFTSDPSDKHYAGRRLIHTRRPPLLPGTHFEQLPQTAGEDATVAINYVADLLYKGVRAMVKRACRPSGEASKARDKRMWNESPLITGIKLGLDDFVIKILKESPMSATYVGLNSMNVLQAAIKYGRRQVAEAIEEEKEKKRLPLWLFTDLESVVTKNTLLHIAASNKNLENKEDPLRLQDELEWFERLKNIVPKELLNYRNKAEKTAVELFDEKHEATLKDCKEELAKIGQTCSPLVAAVVFTSSFYIPGENNRESNRLAFKIFSHVYVVGFSCAATSLIMFLLLVVTPYTQQDFRRLVPRHYLIACLLLAMSLVAFIVAFACNMNLQIYGQKRNSQADLVTLLPELLIVPFLCALALFLSGASCRFGSLLGRLTKFQSLYKILAGPVRSPLLAAASDVFTSSTFYIPGENNRESNRLAFEIFSHVYVVGFSCMRRRLAGHVPAACWS